MEDLAKLYSVKYSADEKDIKNIMVNQSLTALLNKALRELNLAVEIMVTKGKLFNQEINEVVAFSENYNIDYPGLQEKIDLEVLEISKGKTISKSSNPSVLFLLVQMEIAFLKVQVSAEKFVDEERSILQSDATAFYKIVSQATFDKQISMLKNLINNNKRLTKEADECHKEFIGPHNLLKSKHKKIYMKYADKKTSADKPN